MQVHLGTLEKLRHKLGLSTPSQPLPPPLPELGHLNGRMGLIYFSLLYISCFKAYRLFKTIHQNPDYGGKQDNPPPPPLG